MKTLQSKIAIVLLATTVFFNANAEDKKLEKNEATTTSNSILNYKMMNLNIGMYEVGKVNSLKLNLSLTKDSGKTATVKLMNENGNVLSEERISKKALDIISDMISLQSKLVNISSKSLTVNMLLPKKL